MKKSVTISREDLKSRNYKTSKVVKSGTSPEKRRDAKIIATVLAKLV